MKKSSPIFAAGWISIPVTALLPYEIASGSSGTPASFSAWATRCESNAWTPPQLDRISTAPALRAAGSRSRAAATSARISRTTRRSVPTPSMDRRLGSEERQRHVALAAVGNDHDDPLAGELAARADLHRRVDRRARRDPDQQPLPRGGEPRRVDRALVLDLDYLVDHVAVEDLGHEPRPDPLDLVRAGRASRDHRRARRLDCHDVRARAALLQYLPHPGDRASGPDAAHERVDLAVEVSPDLLRRRPPVDLGIGGVSELLRHERVVGGPDDLPREVDRLVHPPERGRLAHHRAVGAKQRRALLAHPLREGEDAVVAAGGADHRQRDPGVAARRLDDQRAPRLDPPLRLGGVDHRRPDPVLDRAGRVEVLQLGHHLGGEVLPQPAQRDHRRVADGIGRLGPDRGPRRGALRHAAQPTRNRARSEAARTFASLSAGNEASSSEERTIMSIVDKATGKLKQAVADLKGDEKLHREGRREQRKGEAKEERAQAHEEADKKATEVADLERKT